MKKTFKTLTAFLLLLSLITIIPPFSSLDNTNAETEISVCGEENETTDVITQL